MYGMICPLKHQHLRQLEIRDTPESSIPHFFVRNTGEEVGAQSRQMSYSASLHYNTKTGTNMKEHHFDAWSLFSVLSSTWIINRSNRMSCTTYLQPVYPRTDDPGTASVVGSTYTPSKSHGFRGVFGFHGHPQSGP